MTTRDLLEEFYSTFYHEDFPVLARYYDFNKKKMTSNYFKGKDFIIQATKPKRDFYISICNKTGTRNKNGIPLNNKKTTRSARFLVVDIDSDHVIKPEIVAKFISAFKYLDFFDHCPYPTAIVASGHGIHFYFQIQEVFFLKSKHQNEKTYEQELSFFIDLFSDASKITREAVEKAIEHTKPYVKNISQEEKRILNSLKVDHAVVGNTQQLIRAPGSYNYKAKQKCEIVFLDRNVKYTMTELINDYRPKYEKITKKVIKITPKGVYTEEDAINLNKRRLEDHCTLIKNRINNDTLKGTRHKIMASAAWTIINIKENNENVNELKELMKIGKLIGNEFQTLKYCQNQLKYSNRYFKTHPKLKNETIRTWLEVTEEEIPKLIGLQPNREEIRTKKREQKAKRKEEAIEWYFENGENKTKTAKAFGISRKTVTRWIQEGEKETLKKSIQTAQAI